MEKNGTIIIGADAPVATDDQASLDLHPDPASLRDLAARLRDDAAIAMDDATKASFLAAAARADGQAEQIEISALWTTPLHVDGSARRFREPEPNVEPRQKGARFTAMMELKVMHRYCRRRTAPPGWC